MGATEIPVGRHSQNPKNPEGTFRFDQAFDAELVEIAKRRARLETKSAEGPDFEKAASLHYEVLEKATLGPASPQNAKIGDSADGGNGAIDPCMGDLAGIALSGGGIRSAAFSLGVAQAMDALTTTRIFRDKQLPSPELSLFEQMDYMSTVSGGGYTGACISAAMMNHGDPFPFSSLLKKDEPPLLQHIRDHSSYLFPRGGPKEKLYNLVSYMRGILAHVPALLFMLLAVVLLTISLKPELQDIGRPQFFWKHLDGRRLAVEFFTVTLAACGVGAGFLVLWAAYRSYSKPPKREYKSWGTRVGALLVALTACAAFMELQPRLVSEIHARYCAKNYNPSPPPDSPNPDLVKMASCKQGLIDELKKLADAAAKEAEAAAKAGKPAPEPKNPDGIISSILSNIQGLTVAITAIAAFVATVKSFLGFGETPDAGKTGVRALIARYSRQIVYLVIGLALPLALWLAYLYLVFWGMKGSDGNYCHAPAWIVWGFQGKTCLPNFNPVLFYGAAAIVSFFVSLSMGANANSPHNLYRDRLAEAFLVGCENGERTSRARKKLSQIGNGAAPVHLVNAALNIQASKKANRRGRNAGFFTFSTRHIGSDETGYLETRPQEAIESRFTLASAMAISAAAASTAMGSITMKPLALTLAALNVRLGYWFANPKRIAALQAPSGGIGPKNYRARYFFHNTPFGYLAKEIGGFMHENGPLVYLSDGGHVENLGLYTLLKRRCKLIVVVDGEADPEMVFSSFVTAQRYARIDLGTRIDMPFDKIAARAKAARAELDPPGKKEAANAEAAAKLFPAADRPHGAIGTIDYPAVEVNGKLTRQTGIIVYLKSSMSGDENDYVRDYARRNRAFPHETTSDQFFSEEQFEAYRALGFHAAYKTLAGYAKIQDGDRLAALTIGEPGNDSATARLASLFLPINARHAIPS